MGFLAEEPCRPCRSRLPILLARTKTTPFVLVVSIDARCFLCVGTYCDVTRCEEKRTRDAWMFLRGLEETARGEELVRMRAEERCTRALLDLELQDLRRIERGQREAEETVKMQSEDRAMRDLKCQEKTQALERQAMRAEDAMARAWKKIEQ